ncbi:HPr family phosphocarrier protein [Microbacterium aerolatum]|uniref:Phosphotransferase n=1 Tax=Microbacterium aerolatum TaxID=153731 RepID=A0A511A9F1_9MICO|nr:HPr family phosphocarrier protein [Microbacterium aerolatum]MCK3769894.1 HPr family phosphocarrier protein [Microbacterium aerolatum]GEK84830.1 phosphotransferase [Microbacterium aerolatum]GGB36550.1 phosphotransferase [Microbacterium aerolatum]
MPIRHVVVSARDGMHARPVAELARLALDHAQPITLTTATGVTVDAGSVLAVMDLALSAGDEVRLETPASASADQVLDELVAVLDPRA